VKSNLELTIGTRLHSPEPPIARYGQGASDPQGGLSGDQLRSAQAECRRDDAWRHHRISLAAYYLAEHRGFAPGSENADWTLAQSQIDAADAT
jgi:hypothetical protein